MAASHRHGTTVVDCCGRSRRTSLFAVHCDDRTNGDVLRVLHRDRVRSGCTHGGCASGGGEIHGRQSGRGYDSGYQCDRVYNDHDANDDALHDQRHGHDRDGRARRDYANDDVRRVQRSGPNDGVLRALRTHRNHVRVHGIGDDGVGEGPPTQRDERTYCPFFRSLFVR